MVDRKAEPTAIALVDDIRMPLALERVKDMWVVSLDDIKDANAESLIIEGGAYDLQPVPSPKTLRRFGLGDAAREE